MPNERTLDWVCGVLRLSRRDILSIQSNPHSGHNNETFVLTTSRGLVLGREAGQGTERFCSREGERLAYEQLAELGITDELLALNPDDGSKLTVYYPSSRTCDPHSPQDRDCAMALLGRLHGAPVRLHGRIDSFGRLREYERIALSAGAHLERDGIRRALDGMRELLSPVALRPVHGDALPDNILFRPDGAALLIDLEFASMGDPYGDIADFCHGSGYAPSQCRDTLQSYLGRAPSRAEMDRLRAFCVCAGLTWRAWAAFKGRVQPERAGFFDDYCRRSTRFAQSMLE